MLIYAMLAITVIFWAGSFSAAKVAVEYLPPYVAAFTRFAGASLILMPLALASAGRKAIPQRKSWPLLAVLGLTGVFAYNVFFMVGLRYTTASNGALIVGINPAVTAVLSVLLLKERLAAKQALGILVSLTGVAIVITGGSVRSILESGVNLGDLLLVGAMLSWVAYTVVGKRVLEDLTPLVSNAWSCSIGALFLLPLAIYQARAVDVTAVPMAAWAGIAYLAVFASAIGFVWWYRGIREIGAARASVFINLNPVFGSLIGWLTLDEQLTAARLLGMAFVVSGVYLTTRTRAAAAAGKGAAATGQRA